MKTAAENGVFKSLHTEIKQGKRVISLSGLTSVAAKSLVLSELQKKIGKTFAIITDSNTDLETFECDLDFFQSQIIQQKSQIQTLPSFESDIYANLSPHAETQEMRALTLWHLVHKQPDFLILSAKSLITKTLTPDEIKNLGANLKRNEDFPPEKLVEKLVSTGYVREEPIKNVGEFSVRGGIIDVWSPTAENPVRIEFFGDTVDSIREFDAETQLSIGQFKNISIAPMREFAARPQDLKDWSFFAREKFADEKFARAISDRAQFSDEGETFAGWEFLFPLVQPRNASIFDFLKDAVFVIDEPLIIEQTLGDFYENLQDRFTEITDAGEIGLELNQIFLFPDELKLLIEQNQRIELRGLGVYANRIDEQFSI